MTTAAWSTVLDHSSDVAFRVWGLELAVQFAAVGMVQTADTGQINWATVTRGGSTNTAAGYEIWRLSGSALYFKIEYGNGNSTSIPSIWLTVGTGSNGSGTLTGQLSTQHQLGAHQTAPTSTSTAYQSYLCATADYFGLSWKIGSSGTTGYARMFVAVMRTVDSTGAATSVGYAVFAQAAGAGVGVSVIFQQCVATTAAVTGPDGINASPPAYCLIPGNYASNPASSQDGAGNNQIFLWWYSVLGTTPVLPLLHAGAILAADLTLGSTASMTLVGSTAHTYINATNGYRSDTAAYVSLANCGTAMLWE